MRKKVAGKRRLPSNSPQKIALALSGGTGIDERPQCQSGTSEVPENSKSETGNQSVTNAQTELGPTDNKEVASNVAVQEDVKRELDNTVKTIDVEHVTLVSGEKVKNDETRDVENSADKVRNSDEETESLSFQVVELKENAEARRIQEDVSSTTVLKTTESAEGAKKTSIKPCVESGHSVRDRSDTRDAVDRLPELNIDGRDNQVVPVCDNLINDNLVAQKSDVSGHADAPEVLVGSSERSGIDNGSSADRTDFGEIIEVEKADKMKSAIGQDSQPKKLPFKKSEGMKKIERVKSPERKTEKVDTYSVKKADIEEAEVVELETEMEKTYVVTVNEEASGLTEDDKGEGKEREKMQEDIPASGTEETSQKQKIDVGSNKEQEDTNVAEELSSLSDGMKSDPVLGAVEDIDRELEFLSSEILHFDTVLPCSPGPNNPMLQNLSSPSKWQSDKPRPNVFAGPASQTPLVPLESSVSTSIVEAAPEIPSSAEQAMITVTISDSQSALKRDQKETEKAASILASEVKSSLGSVVSTSFAPKSLASAPSVLTTRSPVASRAVQSSTSRGSSVAGRHSTVLALLTAPKLANISAPVCEDLKSLVVSASSSTVASSCPVAAASDSAALSDGALKICAKKGQKTEEPEQKVITEKISDFSTFVVTCKLQINQDSPRKNPDSSVKQITDPDSPLKKIADPGSPKKNFSSPLRKVTKYPDADEIQPNVLPSSLVKNQTSISCVNPMNVPFMPLPGSKDLSCIFGSGSTAMPSSVNFNSVSSVSGVSEPKLTGSGDGSLLPVSSAGNLVPCYHSQVKQSDNQSVSSVHLRSPRLCRQLSKMPLNRDYNGEFKEPQSVDRAFSSKSAAYISPRKPTSESKGCSGISDGEMDDSFNFVDGHLVESESDKEFLQANMTEEGEFEYGLEMEVGTALPVLEGLSWTVKKTKKERESRKDPKKCKDDYYRHCMNVNKETEKAAEDETKKSLKNVITGERPANMSTGFVNEQKAKGKCERRLEKLGEPQYTKDPSMLVFTSMSDVKLILENQDLQPTVLMQKRDETMSLVNKVLKNMKDKVVELRYCSCLPEAMGEKIPVEQVFMSNGQLYCLPDANVIRIGRLEFPAFLRQDCFHVPIDSFFRTVGYDVTVLFQSVMKKFPQIILHNLLSDEIHLLEQKYGFDVNDEHSELISLKDIQDISAEMLKVEPENMTVQMLAYSIPCQKVLGSEVRCSVCGEVMKSANPKPVSFVPIMKKNGHFAKQKDQPSTLVEATIGLIRTGGEKLTAFEIENTQYLSIKQLCKYRILTLAQVYEGLSNIQYRPTVAPKEVEDHLQINSCLAQKSLWLDIVSLRCIVCMMPLKKTGAKREIASGRSFYEAEYSLMCEMNWKTKKLFEIDTRSLEILRESCRFNANLPEVPFYAHGLKPRQLSDSEVGSSTDLNENNKSANGDRSRDFEEFAAANILEVLEVGSNVLVSSQSAESTESHGPERLSVFQKTEENAENNKRNLHPRKIVTCTEESKHVLDSDNGQDKQKNMDVQYKHDDKVVQHGRRKAGGLQRNAQIVLAPGDYIVTDIDKFYEKLNAGEIQTLVGSDGQSTVGLHTEDEIAASALQLLNEKDGGRNEGSGLAPSLADTNLLSQAIQLAGISSSVVENSSDTASFGKCDSAEITCESILNPKSDVSTTNITVKNENDTNKSIEQEKPVSERCVDDIQGLQNDSQTLERDVRHSDQMVSEKKQVTKSRTEENGTITASPDTTTDKEKLGASSDLQIKQLCLDINTSGASFDEDDPNVSLHLLASVAAAENQHGGKTLSPESKIESSPKSMTVKSGQRALRKGRKGNGKQKEDVKGVRKLRNRSRTGDDKNIKSGNVEIQALGRLVQKHDIKHRNEQNLNKNMEGRTVFGSKEPNTLLQTNLNADTSETKKKIKECFTLNASRRHTNEAVELERLDERIAGIYTERQDTLKEQVEEKVTKVTENVSIPTVLNNNDTDVSRAAGSGSSQVDDSQAALQLKTELVDDNFKEGENLTQEIKKAERHTDEMTEEKRKDVDMKIKKYILFVYNRVTKTFTAIKYLEGAEKAFPTLFLPYPEHTDTKQRRSKFMVLAALRMNEMFNAFKLEKQQAKKRSLEATKDEQKSAGAERQEPDSSTTDNYSKEARNELTSNKQITSNGEVKSIKKTRGTIQTKRSMKNGVISKGASNTEQQTKSNGEVKSIKKTRGTEQMKRSKKKGSNNKRALNTEEQTKSNEVKSIKKTRGTKKTKRSKKKGDKSKGASNIEEQTNCSGEVKSVEKTRGSKETKRSCRKGGNSKGASDSVGSIDSNKRDRNTDVKEMNTASDVSSGKSGDMERQYKGPVSVTETEGVDEKDKACECKGTNDSVNKNMKKAVKVVETESDIPPVTCERVNREDATENPPNKRKEKNKEVDGKRLEVKTANCVPNVNDSENSKTTEDRKTENDCYSSDLTQKNKSNLYQRDVVVSVDTKPSNMTYEDTFKLFVASSSIFNTDVGKNVKQKQPNLKSHSEKKAKREGLERDEKTADELEGEVGKQSEPATDLTKAGVDLERKTGSKQKKSLDQIEKDISKMEVIYNICDQNEEVDDVPCIPNVKSVCDKTRSSETKRLDSDSDLEIPLKVLRSRKKVKRVSNDTELNDSLQTNNAIIIDETDNEIINSAAEESCNNSVKVEEEYIEKSKTSLKQKTLKRKFDHGENVEVKKTLKVVLKKIHMLDKFARDQEGIEKNEVHETNEPEMVLHSQLDVSTDDRPEKKLMKRDVCEKVLDHEHDVGTDNRLVKRLKKNDVCVSVEQEKVLKNERDCRTDDRLVKKLKRTHGNGWIVEKSGYCLPECYVVLKRIKEIDYVACLARL